MLPHQPQQAVLPQDEAGTAHGGGSEGHSTCPPTKITLPVQPQARAEARGAECGEEETGSSAAASTSHLSPEETHEKMAHLKEERERK